MRLLVSVILVLGLLLGVIYITDPVRFRAATDALVNRMLPNSDTSTVASPSSAVSQLEPSATPSRQYSLRNVRLGMSEQEVESALQCAGKKQKVGATESNYAAITCDEDKSFLGALLSSKARVWRIELMQKLQMSDREFTAYVWTQFDIQSGVMDYSCLSAHRFRGGRDNPTGCWRLPDGSSVYVQKDWNGGFWVGWEDESIRMADRPSETRPRF